MTSGRIDDRLLAHGLGGARDLPIPLDLAIAGAAAALAVSFTVLALAWRSPRYATPLPGAEIPGTTAERPLPRLDRLVGSTGFTVLARGFGLLVLGWALWAAIAGQDLLTNPFLGMFYIFLWVGVVPLSLLLGPFYRAVSPLRTVTALMSRASGTDPDEGLFRLPERLGYWPAALGLLAFVWFELVYHSSTQLGPVRLWFAAYLAVMLIGGALFGNRFLARCDPFEVYSTLVGHLSVWGRREDGSLVLRSPLANLATVRPEPGLVAVVGVLFGSTAFDSFKESTAWLQFTQARLEQAYLLDNLALLAFCAGAAALFAAGCLATTAREGVGRWRLPDAFAHSVVPIIVGYIAAHYLTLLVEQGQMTLIQMSDPLSRGDDLLGTGDWQVHYLLSERPGLLATVKVAGVVLGHVLGVVAAHDRAVALLPRRHQLTGQLPLLAVMVAFTVGGLYLLFAA